jgi:hypothetical protein
MNVVIADRVFWFIVVLLICVFLTAGVAQWLLPPPQMLESLPAVRPLTA